MSFRRWHSLIYVPLFLGTYTLAVTFQIQDDYEKRNPYDIFDYKNHTCRRECVQGSPPLTCRYYFLLELYSTMSTACYNCPVNASHCSLPQCVPGDGTVRGVLTANRMVPGPNVFVCKGDTVEVMVDNRMGLGQGTSIHWHGMRQLGTPYMDGTNLITQCPIHSWSTMKYSFQANDAGTHFWHSHSSMQRAEGLFGGLVVREPKKLDPQGYLYDEDVYDHYILLTDWTQKMSAESYAQDYHGGLTTDIHSILINGVGRTQNNVSLPYQMFVVSPGKKFRFRMVYNGVLNCPIFVTIDEHSLLMIASDGENFEPIEVDAFVIYGGERYDFIVHAKENVQDVFWIRFKGHGRCLGSKAFQAAVLKYEGARNDWPETEATFLNTKESSAKSLLNFKGNPNQTAYQIIDMNALANKQSDHILNSKVDKQFYISIGASELVDFRFDPPTYPPMFKNMLAVVRPTNHQLNYISSRFPASPPLIQFDSIPKKMLCNNESVSNDCSQELCVCIHMLNYSLGDVVELVLVSYKNTLVHPMHMHGHSFYVTTMHRFERPITVNEVKKLDSEHKIPRKLNKAPKKDTIAVPEMGVTIIRFKADNPGFWLFHCHIEFHAELGMFLILKEGNSDQIPDPPEDFPNCRNWEPSITLSKKQPNQTQKNHNEQISSKITFTLGVIMIILALAGFGGLILITLFKRGAKTACDTILLQNAGSYQRI